MKNRLRTALGMQFTCLVSLVLVGCSPDNRDYMPMRVGAKWTYQTQPSLKAYITTFTTTRHVAVGNGVGFELASDHGVSRLAWLGGDLVTDTLANVQVQPPLPLFPAKEKVAVEWRGWLVTSDKKIPAHALITRTKSSIDVLGQSTDTECTRINFNSGKRTFSVITWFLKGAGIVAQEQYDSGKLVNSMQFVAGDQ